MENLTKGINVSLPEVANTAQDAVDELHKKMSIIFYENIAPWAP